MTTITVEIEQLTQALSMTTNKSLGWVVLEPSVVQEDEVTPPSYIEEPPYVMLDFSLVPSSKYLFDYKSVRFSHFYYLLERDGDYEAGELTVLHYMPVSSSQGNELLPPPIEEPFIPPTIITSQRMILGSAGGLGVTFSFIHDQRTNGATAKFGLGFKITNATPDVYPKLIASYITAFQMEDV